MNSNLPKHVFWMVRGLEHALTNGVEFWAEDTSGRSAWLHEDKEAWHVLAGTMLVGCFAYAEGVMSPKWWNNMTSSAARRDLHLLWIARNAFVHKDSNPSELRSATVADIDILRKYCSDLATGRILDDKGNSYPAYMQFIDHKIRFTKDAMHIIASLFETAYRWSNK